MVNNAQVLSKQRSFKRWVKRMIMRNTNPASPLSLQAQRNQQGVFGVPLVVSISYARGTVGYLDADENNHDHAAAIPFVVSKCGSYLKSQGLDTKGVFRLNGNTKRVNTLERIFDSPVDSYGLHHDWQGYTVHDAATLLRRYFFSLPDPVIPASFYQRFRNVMDKSLDDETNERTDAFQILICQLPIAHQDLLFYVLDLLHTFSGNASVTQMDVTNLAALFSPGLLDQHQQQPTAPDTTSIKVVAFLIQHQPLFTMDILVKNEAQLVDIDEALVSPNIHRRSFSPSLPRTTASTSPVSSTKSHPSSASVTSPQHRHLEVARNSDSFQRTDIVSPSSPVKHRQSKYHLFTRSLRLYSSVTAQLKNRLYGAMDWITRQTIDWWHHAGPPLLLGWYFALVIIAFATAYEGHLLLDNMATVEPCFFFGGLACYLYLFIYGIITTTNLSSSSTPQNLSGSSIDNEGDGIGKCHSHSFGFYYEPKTQLDSNQTSQENNGYSEGKNGRGLNFKFDGVSCPS